MFWTEISFSRFELCTLRKSEKFTFFLPCQRKPLIKTFLVCGILLAEGEFFSSHSPKSFANLVSFFLKFVLQMFLFPFRRYDRFSRLWLWLYFIFLLARDFVRNLLINIFPSASDAACLHQTCDLHTAMFLVFRGNLVEAKNLHKMHSINFPPRVFHPAMKLYAPQSIFVSKLFSPLENSNRPRKVVR